MRKIKFRAWVEWYDEWKMLNDVDVIDGKPAKCSCFYDCNGDFYDKGRLMQYTGLKDANGTPIYEGDIVKTNVKGGYLYCFFHEGSFLFRNDRVQWKYRDNMKVVGNIYKNPELLKED